MSKRSYESGLVRVFTLVGHRSAGKTSLGDALLAAAGVTRTMGCVNEGTSLLDHEVEERKNHLSLGPATAWMEWGGHLLYLLDTPGSELVAHEKALPVACSDGVIVVVSAPDNIEVGTERALELASRDKRPRLIVVNKMDRSHSIGTIQTRLNGIDDNAVVPLQLPWYDAGGDFGGVICLIRRNLHISGSDSPIEVPPDYVELVDAAREKLVESVALLNDDLIEDYLEFFDLNESQMLQGIRSAVHRGVISPLVYAASKTQVGVQALLDTVVDFLPNPKGGVYPIANDDAGEIVPIDGTDFIAQVVYSRLDDDNERFHVLRIWAGQPGRHGRWYNGTNRRPFKVRRLYHLRGPRRCSAFYVGPGSLVATWDPIDVRPGDCVTEGRQIDLSRPHLPPAMMALSVRPKLEKHRGKVDSALAELLSMDRSLRGSVDELTGNILLSGSGDAHLRRCVQRLEALSGVSVETGLPLVGYREVPMQPVHDIEGVHERITDGCVSEFGACRVSLRPEFECLTYNFVDHSQEEDVPSRFRAPIDEGIQSGLRHGPTAGYPVVGAEVCLDGGDYNMLTSTEEHFRLAGSNAVKNALEKSGTYLMEPWCRVDIWSPCELGAVLADISANRGRVLGLEVEGRDTHIQAHYPYRELRTFASRLEGLTFGRGRFVYTISHYDRLPSNQIADVVRSSPFRQEPLCQISSSRGSK